MDAIIESKLQRVYVSTLCSIFHRCSPKFSWPWGIDVGAMIQKTAYNLNMTSHSGKLQSCRPHIFCSWLIYIRALLQK